MTSSARRVFEHALSLERAGDGEAALAAYLEALDLAPDDVDIAYRTATALLRAGMLDEAVSQLRRIVFAEPAHTAARANLGNCQLLLGDLANAELNFQEVLAGAPDNHNALYGLATVRVQQDKPEEALAPAQRLIELLPDNAPAQTLYAQSRARDPQPSAAIAAFRKAIHIDPAYVPALTGLAEVLIRARRFPEAIALAEEATALQPANADTYRILAAAHLAAGDFSIARDILVKALSLGPGDVETLNRLSVASRKLEDYPAALLHAWQAHRKQPDNKDAGNALGSALAALGHPKDAKAVLTAIARKRRLEKEVESRISTLCAEIELQERSGALMPEPEPAGAEASSSNSEERDATD